MPTKMTTEDFIKKSKTVHNERYLYHKTKYTNKRSKITITCRVHGDFEVLPRSHYANKHHCPKCAKVKELRSKNYTINNVKTKNTGSYSRMLKYNKQYYAEKASKLHSNFYTYVNTHEKVTNIECDTLQIICPNHGVFNQTIRLHLSGCGCPKCGTKKATSKNILSFEHFLKRAADVHNKKYTYYKDTYTKFSSKTKITCPIHGDTWQYPHYHVTSKGCPKCAVNPVSNWKSDFYKNKATILYVLELPNNLYKIGITTQESVNHRYSSETTNFKAIFTHTFKDGFYAHKYEQKLLKDLKAFLYKGEPVMSTVKTKEILTVNPVSIIKSQIKGMF
jgi:predicted nucleic-acid-binding Zn-ribbon protein